MNIKLPQHTIHKQTFVAHDKRGVSAAYIARKLELTYPTAWLLLHKIRKAMGDRDAFYQLAGLIELDDAFFGAPTEGGKRGRGYGTNASAGWGIT